MHAEIVQNAVNSSGDHSQIPAAIFPAFVARLARETEDAGNFVSLILPWFSSHDSPSEEEKDQGPKEETSGFCHWISVSM